MANEERVNVNRLVRATGKEEVRKLIAMMHAAFPDATFSLVQRVEDDAGALAYVWSARGTNSGEVGGFAPTGATAHIVSVASLAPRGGSSQKP